MFIIGKWNESAAESSRFATKVHTKNVPMICCEVLLRTGRRRVLFISSVLANRSQL